jgi:hypothetical protein
MSKTPSVTVSSALTQRVTTATTNAFNALQDQLRRVFQQEALQLKQSNGTATLRMVGSDVDKVKRWAQESSAGATLDDGIAKFFKLPADMKQQALLPVTSNDARNQVFADVSRRGADTGLKARVAAVLTGTAAALASWWGSGPDASVAPVSGVWTLQKQLQEQTKERMAAQTTAFRHGPNYEYEPLLNTSINYKPPRHIFKPPRTEKQRQADFRLFDLRRQAEGQTATVLTQRETLDASRRAMAEIAKGNPATVPRRLDTEVAVTAVRPLNYWESAQKGGALYESDRTIVYPKPPAPEPISIWDRVTSTVSGWWDSLTGDQATTSLLPVILLSLTVAAGGYALWKWTGSGTQTVTVDQFVQMKLTERESQEGLQSLGIQYDQESDEFRPLSNDPMHVGRAKLFTLLKGNGSITVNTATVKVQ